MSILANGGKKIILSEHDCFQRIIEGLSMAADGATMMATHRPDVGFMWLKMAEAMGINKMSVNKLAEEAAIRSVERMTKKS